MYDLFDNSQPTRPDTGVLSTCLIHFVGSSRLGPLLPAAEDRFNRPFHSMLCFSFLFSCRICVVSVSSSMATTLFVGKLPQTHFLIRLAVLTSRRASVDVQ